MKKRLWILTLVVALILSTAACEPKSEKKETKAKKEKPAETVVEKKVDYDAVYAELIEAYYYTVKYAEMNNAGKEGFQGVWEVGNYEGEEALDIVGYAIMDINDDGVMELLIGQSYGDEYAYVKNDLYALYALDYETPKLVLEGRSRNSYSLLDKGEIYNGGSNGAAYRVFGTYKLGDDAKLECLDFNFSYERGDDYTDVGFFNNKTGIYDRDQAEDMQITFEEFSEMESSLAKRSVSVDFTPLSSFSPAGDGAEFFNGELAGEPVYFAVNGNWKGDVKTDDGQLWTIALDLYSDGSGSYRCGPAESEYIVHFRGRWKSGAKGTSIILEMEDSYGSGSFNGEFRWNVNYDTLTLMHLDGDTLIYDTEGKMLQFKKQ